MFLCRPRSRLRILPGETDSVVPFSVSLLILPTQGESVAYSRGPPAFRDGVHLHRQPPSGRSHVYRANKREKLARVAADKQRVETVTLLFSQYSILHSTPEYLYNHHILF